MTKHLRRFLLYPLAATLLALGLMIGLGAAAGASTTHATPAAATAIAKAAIKDLDIGQHGTIHRASSHLSKKIDGQSVVETYNWSGYADTGSGYNEVSGSWTEPSASCGSELTLAAFWVGIDGYNDGTVEQDGTLIECYEGTAYQYSWWEMYPSNAIQIVGESVQSGDLITASVNVNGSNYLLTVLDTTDPANDISTTQSCSDCDNDSAEWIAEAPSGSDGIYPLTDFGTWTLTNSTVVEGSSSGVISTFPDDELIMIDSSGNVEAQPGSLTSGGSSFSDTWERSS
ncbi:MAG: G1 family glutamic endopeptidase [Streptosporangiaceae bacterium]|jgi:hypothetical protein